MSRSYVRPLTTTSTLTGQPSGTPPSEATGQTSLRGKCAASSADYSCRPLRCERERARREDADEPAPVRGGRAAVGDRIGVGEGSLPRGGGGGPGRAPRGGGP